MRILLVILTLLCNYQTGKAQLFGKNDLSVQYGTINFHAKSLNNSLNNNHRLSHVTEIDKHIHLGKFISGDLGLGLGTLQNMDTRFTRQENSSFFRIKLGLVLHLPQAYSANNWSPKQVNPYFKVAYNFDRYNEHYKNIEGKYLGNSVRMGLGVIYRVNHQIGLVYEGSHNQCFSSDFRTYFQQNIGIFINMDQILLSR